MTPDRPSFGVVLFVAALGSTMYLGDIDIGPFSPRVYCYGLIAVWIAYRLLIKRDSLPLDRRVGWLLLAYLAYCTWSIVAALLQQASLKSVLGGGVLYHAFALATFVAALFALRTRRDVSFLLWSMSLLVLVSCVVSMLQWYGDARVWQVWFRLRPQHVSAGPGLVYGEWGPTPLPNSGLFASNVTFGYYVAMLAPVIFRRYLARRTLLSLTGFCVFACGVLLVQQRSALLATLLLVGALILMRLGTSGQRLRTMMMVGVGAALAFAILVGAFGSTLMESRYARMVDTGRLEVAQIALGFIAAEPVLGGIRSYSTYFYDHASLGTHYEVVTPHNMFLNAAVMYGLPALFLTLVLMTVLGAMLLPIWREARARKDWTSTTLVLSLVGYLINAQFHNASFVTGDFLPWVFIAALLTSSRRPKPGRAADSAPAVQRQRGMMRPQRAVPHFQ